MKLNIKNPIETMRMIMAVVHALCIGYLTVVWTDHGAMRKARCGKGKRATDHYSGKSLRIEDPLSSTSILLLGI